MSLMETASSSTMGGLNSKLGKVCHGKGGKGLADLQWWSPHPMPHPHERCGTQGHGLVVTLGVVLGHGWT